MKLLKFVLPLVAVCGFSASTAMAKNCDGGFEINERDIQAVKQHLKTKRDMRLSDKHDDLNISGDIRWEYKHIEEEIDNDDQRGNGSHGVGDSDGNQTLGTTKFGENEWDVEFNLYFDYTAESTWAHVHLEFDNCAGIEQREAVNNSYYCGSGSCHELCLRSAYFGYNVFEEGSSRLDTEWGRWDMYNIFDSRVQFQHRYDGALFTYSNSFEDVGDFYIKGGYFIIDSLASNTGYAVEVALVDMLDVGLDLKYSYTDYKGAQDRYGNSTGNGSDNCKNQWRARISQFTAAYHFNPEFVNEDIKLYGAFLMNHSAQNNGSAGGSGDDIGWYLGLMIGGIQGEGDWSVDFNYQWVKAQLIPDFAVSGVGTGNVNGFDRYSAPFTGNTNYHGFQLEGGYALTDNLLILGEVEWSTEESSAANNGNSTDYIKYELEMMYSF